MKPEPRVTVVVLTHNRREQVLRTVAALRLLAEQPPIVVVDNASGDGTAQALRERFPDVTVIRSRENLGASARNLGAQAARTPYVAFCDDDVHWRDGALGRACGLLDAHPGIGVLCARVVVGERAFEDPTSALMARSPLDSTGLPGRAIVGFMAGASVIRTAAFLDAGGYCEKLFIGGEEELLAIDLMTAGWRLVYAPTLVAHHWPSSLRDSKRRRRLLARNAAWIAWMRFPWPQALARTVTELRKMAREQALWSCGWETLKGLPWAWARRRVMPGHVLAMVLAAQREERRSALAFGQAAAPGEGAAGQ